MEPPLDEAVLERMNRSVMTSFARAGIDYETFTEQRWALHRAHGDVTVEQYRCRLLHTFGQIVSRKSIVYLDLKYWINLRKVVLRQPTNPAYTTLLDILQEAARCGVIVCPLSFWVFEELLKQGDSSTRKATARLIDELSSGVAFMHHGEIVGQEVLHFIRTISPRYQDVKQWPIRECIWTRTFSFLGDRIPVWPETIPQSDQLLVQKNMEDCHFFVPLEDLLEDADTIAPDSVKPMYDVADINRRKAQVRREHKSFKSIFLAELMHTIKENEDHWYSTMSYLQSVETGGPEERIDVDALSDLQKRPWRNLVYWSFQKDKVGNQLPSYHIPAALYAASSWDAKRQLTENDVFDFYHAQLAIPYSDLFLTDSSLKALVCSRHLKLDEIYNTEIISDPAEAVTRLRERLVPDANVSNKPIVNELFRGDTYARSS